jgi:pimeloyl-ACP methyl ester carboxylesterase
MMTGVQEFLNCAPPLVIAFAGGPQNRFQFGKSLTALKVPHVLLRDETQRHYEFGIGMMGEDLLVEYINTIAKEFYLFRVILVGVSSGAYAALKYGLLASVSVDEVVAISPITGRSQSTAADFPAEYWDRIVDPNQPDLDLKPLYSRWDGNPKVRAFISDGEGCELDRRMCERIGIPGENIQLVPGYSHGNLARGMRDLGMFGEIFK